jgi:hypothetical protein
VGHRGHVLSGIDHRAAVVHRLPAQLTVAASVIVLLSAAGGIDLPLALLPGAPASDVSDEHGLADRKMTERKCAIIIRGA